MSSTGQFSETIRRRHGLREDDLEGYVTNTTEVLDAIEDVLYVCTESGALRRWNERLPERTGYTDEELSGMTMQDCFEPATRDRVDDAIAEALATGRSSWVGRMETAGRSVPVEFTARVHERADDTTILAGTGRVLPGERDDQYRIDRSAFRQINEFVTDESLAIDDRIEGLLEVGRRNLGVEEAFFAAISESTERFEVQVTAGSDLVPAGLETVLEATYCARTVETNEIVELSDITDLETESYTESEQWDTEAYVGGRIVVGEAVHGTICFVDRERRDVSLSERERQFVNDLRQAVRHVLEQRYEQRRLERAIEAAPIGISIVDTDCNGQPLAYTNDQFEELTGRFQGMQLGAPCCETEVDRPASIVVQQLLGANCSDADGNCADPTAVEQLRTAVANGARKTAEVRCVHDDGTPFWSRVSVVPIEDETGDLTKLVSFQEEITDRKEREREIERTRQLLAQAQRLAGICGCEIEIRNGEPQSVTVTTDGDTVSETELPFTEAMGLIHPPDRQRVTDAIEHTIDTGEGFDVEFRIERGEGYQWQRAIGEAVVENDDVGSIRAAVQDVSDHKRHQLALQSLQDATRGLLGTNSESEIAEFVVSVAAEVLNVPSAAVYQLEPESGVFRPLSVSPTVATLRAQSRDIDVNNSDSLVWQAFASGTTTVPGEAAARERSVLFDDDTDGLLVPIGDHGVFVAASDSGRIDESTRQLVETLVATAEAAFDRLESEATLRERDAELEARNDRLRRQIQINDIIRSINKSLMRVTSREDVETAVCDRLVEEECIEFAWIGDLDAGSRLDPRTWAGSNPEYLDGIALQEGESAPEPALRTALSCEPTVVENVLEDVQTANWRKQALVFDFHSVVCVPLAYDEYTYGVLAVYADSNEAFGELECTVFEELGETIANSINAVETRRALHADTALELSIEFDAPESFCHRLATEAGCRVGYEGLATDSVDETRLFVTTADADTEAVSAVLDELVSVSTYSVINDAEDGQLFVATVTGPTVPSRIVRHGGRPCSMTATPDGMDVRVDLPRKIDVREFLTILEDQFGNAELTTRRTVERERHTVREHVATLVDSLTDRQREVLRTAYFSGYFEWPRESTGEEIAKLLDVSQPTVNRHIRLGQKRLLAQLFDDDRQSATVDS